MQCDKAKIKPMLEITSYQGWPCLPIKVTPGAPKNQILGGEGACLKIKIKAQPEKGKANDELIAFLAEQLALRKSSIRLVQGTTGRQKLVVFEDQDLESLQKKLQRIL